uniref:C-type lectin domain-containing protein n=1 Tax=Oreochromis aureus TaxID=47969 RepID=A0AAZ1XDJ8_OREAU
RGLTQHTLLYFTNRSTFGVTQSSQYHFIAENKSWYEAQRYCREKYTDLAKVFDMTDMSRLRNSTQNQGEAWIGLNNNTGGNRTWHWSLPGVEYIHNDSSWDLNGRYGTEKPGNCGRKRYDNGDKKLVDVSCNHTMWFICYDGEKITSQNWKEGQSYCRSIYTDLASGLNQVDGEEMKDLCINSTFSAWVGLFRDSWRWSDGSDFSFRYWDMELFNDEQSNKTCAMTLLNRSGKWSSDECDREKPFFCYDDKLILIKENKTWEEALDYCRKYHRVLVSITNHYQQRWAEVRAKNASSPFVWLGLRYSCTLGLWFWVNDKLVCYEKWSKNGTTEECDVAVGMQSGGQHEWFSQRENQTYNFFCLK